MEANFPEKEIMIVETGYPYAWEVPGTDQPVDYPYSESGQNEFAQDLVKTLSAHENVTGLFWWWIEYNAFGTNLSGWYNAPLFDSRTGKATSALKTICEFGTAAGVDTIINDSAKETDNWYDLKGIRVEMPDEPGIYIKGNKKYILR